MIFTQIESVPVGSVLVCDHGSYTEVLHVYIEKPYRRQGFAQELIERLKEEFPYLITGWTHSEPAGRELFLKCGFEVKKSMFKKRTTNLEWKR
jgi:GNAT superfamily N-acetyltransferase